MPRKCHITTIDRTSLGLPGDYKPMLAFLSPQRILLTAFHQCVIDSKSNPPALLETPLLFESSDEGRTWSQRHVTKLVGREPYISVISENICLMTCHLIPQEIRNLSGQACPSLIHRSQDAGSTWHTTWLTESDVPHAEPVHGFIQIGTSRNIISLADGSLLLLVSASGPQHRTNFAWRSFDRGQTWPERQPISIAKLSKGYRYPFINEGYLYLGFDNVIYLFQRVDSASMPRDNSALQEAATNDQYDWLAVFCSEDQGLNWQYIGHLEGYGKMYPSVLPMERDAFLLTYTQRSMDSPLGLRARFGRITKQGPELEPSYDELIIDARTAGNQPSGGGFGNTLELQNGDMLSTYSYRDEQGQTQMEVVRWLLPTFDSPGVERP